MIRILVDLCDEFLMNAIYDAPRDEEGKPIYASTPRNERVLLKPDQAAKFRYASDGELLAISVEDAFGAINRDKVVSYLSKCFAKGDDQIDAKEGGAGLGLYIIWKSVNHFILNIDPGVRTEFVGIIDLSLSIREFKTKNRSFHLFSTQSHL